MYRASERATTATVRGTLLRRLGGVRLRLCQHRHLLAGGGVDQDDPYTGRRDRGTTGPGFVERDRGHNHRPYQPSSCDRRRFGSGPGGEDFVVGQEGALDLDVGEADEMLRADLLATVTGDDGGVGVSGWAQRWEPRPSAVEASTGRPWRVTTG